MLFHSLSGGPFAKKFTFVASSIQCAAALCWVGWKHLWLILCLCASDVHLLWQSFCGSASVFKKSLAEQLRGGRSRNNKPNRCMCGLCSLKGQLVCKCVFIKASFDMEMSKVIYSIICAKHSFAGVGWFLMQAGLSPFISEVFILTRGICLLGGNHHIYVVCYNNPITHKMLLTPCQNVFTLSVSSWT